jgi:hypothetical protein
LNVLIHLFQSNNRIAGEPDLPSMIGVLDGLPGKRTDANANANANAFGTNSTLESLKKRNEISSAECCPLKTHHSRVPKRFGHRMLGGVTFAKIVVKSIFSKTRVMLRSLQYLKGRNGCERVIRKNARTFWHLY